MVKEVIFIVEESLEGGYTAKALGESIFTQGDSVAELKTNIKEAVFCHYDDDMMPKIIRLHFVKEELLTL